MGDAHTKIEEAARARSDRLYFAPPLLQLQHPRWHMRRGSCDSIARSLAASRSLVCKSYCDCKAAVAP